MSQDPTLDSRLSFMKFDDKARRDIQNVRAVVHETLPKALDAFYDQAVQFAETKAMFSGQAQMARPPLRPAHSPTASIASRWSKPVNGCAKPAAMECMCGAPACAEASVVMAVMATAVSTRLHAIVLEPLVTIVIPFRSSSSVEILQLSGSARAR